MNEIKEKLISWLFETQAIRVSPKDKPFWYTSGKIGPYYVNTHFLYGNQDKAEELLGTIDAEKNDKFACSGRILELTLENYRNDVIYKGLIDIMTDYIKSNDALMSADLISGGERRDWFFSLIIAHFLGKPHITMFKNLSSVCFMDGKSSAISDAEGKSLLHIADIITEASSYTKQWIPAALNINCKIQSSLVVVDRLQGGAQNLKTAGVGSYALVEMDKGMFDKAFGLGYIDKDQYKTVIDYMEDPEGAMRNFLIEHPDFLENALMSDEKTSSRARLCIEQDFYSLNKK